MPSNHRNPDIGNTAARYVCKAMCAVHVRQRLDVLKAIRAHCEAGVAYIEGSTRENRDPHLARFEPDADGRVTMHNTGGPISLTPESQEQLLAIFEREGATRLMSALLEAQLKADLIRDEPPPPGYLDVVREIFEPRSAA